METTDAGRLGEAKVLARLTELGWYPFVDVSGKCPVDIIAWKDGVAKTFQVKATAYKGIGTKYLVQIGSVRPNRTGNVIKKFSPDSCDYLAIYIIPENRVVFIDAKSVVSGRQITIQDHHTDVIGAF